MASKVKPVPDGYHTVTPYLSIEGAAKALEFYKRAFGAEELVRMDMPGGRIGHAEIRIGDSVVMLADDQGPMPEANQHSPHLLGGTSVSLMIYFSDVDAQFKRAVEAGATVKRPLENQFYGDRSATLVDPFGHVWTIATHIEDVSPEEMKRRMSKS